MEMMNNPIGYSRYRPSVAGIADPHLVYHLRQLGYTTVSPKPFAIYLAICSAADNGLQLSVREICDIFGWKSPNAAWQSLQELRDAGLISFESTKARTIRPLYRVRLFKEDK